MSPTGSARHTQTFPGESVPAGPAVSGLRGAEGALAAVAGLEGQYGRALHARRERCRGGQRQRGFPEAEGQDACRAGPETVGEPYGQQFRDLPRPDTGRQPLGYGRCQSGGLLRGQDQAGVDPAQGGQYGDRVGVGVGVGVG